MGHERLGILPKTKPWIRIVDELMSSDLAEDKVKIVASQTIENVRDRLNEVEGDSGVIASFKFLVTLAVSSQFANPLSFLADSNVDIGTNASPYFIAKALHKYVEATIGSLEYGEIARAAAVDAVSIWHGKNSQQLRMFDTDNNSVEAWRGTGGGVGFCEISRLFFAKTTERYLNYFLERALSSSVKTLQEREALRKRLNEHINIASQHAFETAKITQSFAAGWFNKHADREVPSDYEIRTFLRIAFGKLREELRREEAK
ncbi:MULTISPECIES: hypothetical protein [Dehalococcoides]|uniref:Uncharacterized protein n=1 Tax=Dehalococcoides mccartyi TaxID=61435 RepID=A0AB38Z9F9_9CHLR|nr:hypothetical protein [Dehalococcoides mccartyi]AHB14111.1 hypothetical protein GY50_1340 [Dehalococcoides mccartyi GY50]APH13018.1 hypothetical protein ASJ33_07550 [Dehalococcoides mccartyi]WRO07206.1 hypothetical protein VLL09_07425 [Dehalococcoides mccartyi]